MPIVFFLLCATAVELHLALLVVAPARYLRLLNGASSQAFSWRMRGVCLVLFCLILSIQHVGLERLLLR